MNICGRCGEEVFFAEQKLAIGKVWHTFCFSCCKCGKLLDSCSVCPYNSELYCPGCYRGVSSTPSLPSCLLSKPRRCNPSIPFKPHRQVSRNYRYANCDSQNCYKNHSSCDKNCIYYNRCNCERCVGHLEIQKGHLEFHKEKAARRPAEIEELKCTCGKCKKNLEQSRRCYCGGCSSSVNPEKVLRHYPGLLYPSRYNKQKNLGRQYNKSPEVL